MLWSSVFVWALWIHALQESRIRRRYGRLDFTGLCASLFITIDNRKGVWIRKGL